jgi:hypothetical protein
MRDGSRRRGDDGADDAQMMLLAAVLLVIGFIALAGLVSVAQRLGEETLQEEGSVVLLQTQPLLDIIERVVDGVYPDPVIPAPADPKDADVEVAMQHLARIAAGQGLLLVGAADGGFVANDCAGDVPATGEWTVSFDIADAATQLTFHAASRAC